MKDKLESQKQLERSNPIDLSWKAWLKAIEPHRTNIKTDIYAICNVMNLGERQVGKPEATGTL